MQLKCNSKLDTVTQTEQSKDFTSRSFAYCSFTSSTELETFFDASFSLLSKLLASDCTESRFILWHGHFFFFHERIFHSVCVCVCKNVEETLYPAAFWQISMSSGNANSSGWFSSASYKKKGRWSYEQICALRQKVVYLQDVMEQCNAALVGFSLRQFEKRADFESLGISCMASLEGKAFKAIL